MTCRANHYFINETLLEIGHISLGDYTNEPNHNPSRGFPFPRPAFLCTSIKFSIPINPLLFYYTTRDFKIFHSAPSSRKFMKSKGNPQEFYEG